jgi:hypothetical protein
MYSLYGKLISMLFIMFLQSFSHAHSDHHFLFILMLLVSVSLTTIPYYVWLLLKKINKETRDNHGDLWKSGTLPLEPHLQPPWGSLDQEALLGVTTGHIITRNRRNLLYAGKSCGLICGSD